MENVEGGRKFYEEFGEETDMESLFKYAGTPIGFPSELLETHFGVLNKQLAFANWDEADVDNIAEDIMIDYLRTITSRRRYVLKGINFEIFRQIKLIAMGLASLGKRGYLLDKATTSVREFRERKEQDKKGIIGLFKR